MHRIGVKEGSLNTNELRIHVSGFCNSGKSTISLMIVDFLREKGLDVDFIDEFETEESTRNSQSERELIITDKIKKISVIETKIYTDLITNG